MVSTADSFSGIARAAASAAALFDWLRGLASSGSDGFEGFVADALSELTGRAFRLVKAGPQDGADVLSDSETGKAIIAVEAKRFREGTPLALDELQAKVVDVGLNRTEVDLWVLAASRQIAADDAARLEAAGAGFGMDVLVIDTRPGADGLSPLEILSAAAPQAVLAQFPGQPDLKVILAGTRLTCGFEAALSRLRKRLASPEIGYDAARSAMAAWMRDVMSDLATAKGALGSHADLRADGGRRGVDRATAAAHMAAAVADPSRPHALLGSEGIGKTWSVLRWWDVAAEGNGLGLPLTVWMPATRVGDGDDLIATAGALLSERTGTRSPAFWQARLRRWRTSGVVRLLLIVDGLNQNFFVRRWTDLLQPLFGRDWRGTIAVAVTCRPDHWTQLGGLGDLVPEPLAAELGPFNNTELNHMLDLHGLRRDDLPAALLELMRVPRLFSLAARLAGNIQSVGELTPEFLALADWRDRVGLHGNRIALGADEFRMLVSQLGARLKAAMAEGGETDITRRELMAELGRDSGYGDPELAGAVSELVDGGWLKRTDPHRFRLAGAPAWLAMGLSLLDVLRGKADEVAAADAIADFLDPFRGADIGVAVLRAATTASLLEPGTPPWVRRALLLAWVSAQNFGSTDFEALWRLVGLDPMLFVRIADEGWRFFTFDHRQDEAMAKALANASKWEGAAIAVDAALRSWMSAVPLPDAAGDHEDVRATIRALQLKSGLPAAALLHPEVEMDGWLCACRNAFVICSFRRRAPVADGYGAWALAGALAGRWAHTDLADWSLRLNEEDAAEAGVAVLETCRGMLASGDAHARVAVGRLLSALATRPATDLAAEWGIDLSDGACPYEPQATISNARGASLTSGEVVALGAEAGSLAAKPDPAHVAALVGFCHSAPAKALAAAFADGVMQGAIPALARWAPGEVDGYVRRLANAARSQTPPPRWLMAVCERAPGLAGLISEGTRDALVDACGALPPLRKPYWITGAAITALACYGRTAEEQLKVLADAYPIGITRAARLVLKPLPPDAVLRAACERAVERPEEERPEYWLRHLAWSRDLHELPLPDPAGPFIDLTGHADARVLALAMSVLHGSLDCGAAAAEFAARGWRWIEGMEREEAAHGSLLLLEAKPALGSSVLDRADQQVSVAAFHQDPLEGERLSAFLVSEVGHIQDRVPHSSERTWCREDVLDGFVERHAEMAERLAQPAIGSNRSRSTFLFLGFPAMGLCHGLLRYRPQVGAALWRSLMDEQEIGITKRGDLALMPFTVPRGDVIDALREHALSLARNDTELAAIAAAATLDENDEWVEEVVSRDLDAPSASKAARALVLAGKMHATPRARALWAGRLAEPPGPGWLAAVHAAAKDSFRSNLDALHWLDMFLDARCLLDISAAYALFASRADGRAFEQGTCRLRALHPKIPPIQLLRWNLDVADSSERIGQMKSDCEKLFGFTRRAAGLGPWA